MKAYLSALTALLKDWKKVIPAIILTIARIIYGWKWLEAGIHKFEWLSDDKLNSLGKIETMYANIAGPEVTRFDPLGINKAFGWIADTFFAGMPAITDILVVILEVLVGVAFIIGFKIFISALVSTFMNMQFFAGGSFNNFGYIWSNLIFMKLAKYTEAIGIGGFLRIKKGKELI